MKPFKLLACLVTLQFTCGLTLQAADPQSFRQWTDTNGRTITARLLDTPDAESVKIERQDGRVFTVALKTFSTADQNYVTAVRAETSAAGAATTSTGGASFKDPDPATWALLNTGTQPASQYSNTRLDQVIEGINQRFAVKDIKTPAGLPLQVRTEPVDLAERIKISGDMPRMSVASFVKEVARSNALGVKTDAAGMVVLVEKAPAASAPAPAVSFFGVPVANN